MSDKQKIDELILECNTAIHELVSGNYVSWCNLMARIVRELAELKQTINTDGGDE